MARAVLEVDLQGGNCQYDLKQVRFAQNQIVELVQGLVGQLEDPKRFSCYAR